MPPIDLGPFDTLEGFDFGALSGVVEVEEWQHKTYRARYPFFVANSGNIPVAWRSRRVLVTGLASGRSVTVPVEDPAMQFSPSPDTAGRIYLGGSNFIDGEAARATLV